ncbi:unnamed protein product [Allacma fusca]|uniref:Uncharacterized protein n=1 Tax=Allacma fusca TaxID=39272 RepID=A0A8J2PEK0_9HEXA|nr:unnamed protein product [Allacma fusca]
MINRSGSGSNGHKYIWVRMQIARIFFFPSSSDFLTQNEKYLYPSLNLNAEDLLTEGARSLSLKSWMDDLVEYWETECSKVKRKAMRTNTTRAKSRVRNSTRSSLSSFKNYTITNIPKDVLAERVGIYLNNSQSLNKTSRQSDLFGISLPGPGLPDLTQLGISTLPTPTIDPLLLRKNNKWFQSYGGDIEYFFPLIGFGIPFDGEITLLGFHGFKGLFPYKR